METDLGQTEEIYKLDSNKFSKGRILFSDEKFFDIDGIYNCQNEPVWAVDCFGIDKKGDIPCKNLSEKPRLN